MSFNDWLKGRGRRDDDAVEYYEDTHDEKGNYIGRGGFRDERLAGSNLANGAVEHMGVAGKNIVVYRPKNPDEVQVLITFLQRGEPAVANLNGLDDARAQRILDFLSGAVFALGGSVYRIIENIFLLSPSGMGIQSYDNKDKNGKK